MPRFRGDVLATHVASGEQLRWRVIPHTSIFTEVVHCSPWEPREGYIALSPGAPYDPEHDLAV